MYLCLKIYITLHKIIETMDEIQRIKQLRQELHEHNYRYYVLNQPTIGDQDFDFLSCRIWRQSIRRWRIPTPLPSAWAVT